jgi:hypothetical protein
MTLARQLLRFRKLLGWQDRSCIGAGANTCAECVLLLRTRAHQIASVKTRIAVFCRY